MIDVNTALDMVTQATTLSELDAVEDRLFGDRGFISGQEKMIGPMSLRERVRLGPAIQDMRVLAMQALAARRTILEPRGTD